MDYDDELPPRATSSIRRGQNTAGATTKRFITPTQGLMARQGQSLTSNLENVGGRLMIQAEMERHKHRMKQVKAVISLNPPWGHEDSRPKSTIARGAGVKAVRRPNSASGFYNTTGSTSGNLSASTVPNQRSSSPQQTPLPCFDVSQLNDEDVETYRSMLRLLCRMSNQESRAVLEQLYRESEDRKLLAGYTGVFPKLENESGT